MDGPFSFPLGVRARLVRGAVETGFFMNRPDQSWRRVFSNIRAPNYNDQSNGAGSLNQPRKGVPFSLRNTILRGVEGTLPNCRRAGMTRSRAVLTVSPTSVDTVLSPPGRALRRKERVCAPERSPFRRPVGFALGYC